MNRSLQEGTDRRPGRPKDPGRRPGLQEAPETPEDNKELPGSRIAC